MADEKEYQVTRTFVNEDDKLDAGPALTLSRVDEITNELHDDKRVLHNATNVLRVMMVITTAALAVAAAVVQVRRARAGVGAGVGFGPAEGTLRRWRRPPAEPGTHRLLAQGGQ